MSKFLKIPYGDYTIETQEGGVIVLNTGNENGVVRVTGDLIVQGNATTVQSENMTVKDNIIIVNSGETGAGITLDSAGIRIDRGTNADTFLVFDENIANVVPGGTDGAFRLYIADGGSGTLKGLQTNHINTGGSDLYLISNGTGVITVTGTTDYENNVFTYTDIATGTIDLTGGSNSDGVIDPDNIPNTKSIVDYVNSYFAGVFQDRIEEGTITKTFVETIDREDTGNPSLVQIGIDDVVVSEFYENRVEIQGIRILDTKIESTVSNSDLTLSAPGTGTVRINDVLQINATPGDDDGLLEPSAPDDSSAGLKLYTNVPQFGDTGLYFVNSFDRRDEIVSNNKSMIYSMIF